MVYKDVGFVENHINKDLEAGQVWKEVVLGQEALKAAMLLFLVRRHYKLLCSSSLLAWSGYFRRQSRVAYKRSRLLLGWIHEIL